MTGITWLMISVAFVRGTHLITKLDVVHWQKSTNKKTETEQQQQHRQPQQQEGQGVDPTCQFCAANCCSIYAYCISCCLKHANIQHSADRFHTCMSACRTSSVSVVNEKEWKSPLKYCFPKDGQPTSVTPRPVPHAISSVESFPKENVIAGRFTDHLPDDGEGVGGGEGVKPTGTSTTPTTTITPSSTDKKSEQQDSILMGLQEQLSRLQQQNKQLSNQIEQLLSVPTTAPSLPATVPSSPTITSANSTNESSTKVQTGSSTTTQFSLVVASLVLWIVIFVL